MSSSNNRQLTATSILGLASARNYILNPSAHISTAGWATYADTAQARPVDGTGGTANITWTRGTSSPLSGDGSFLLTKDAANRQGQGASYDFSIDAADRAKMLQISFDYSVDSGTFVAGTDSTDSDVICYIYDVTNARLVEPTPFKLSQVGSFGNFVGNFAAAADSTSYRLIMHVASTSASAYTLKFDNFSVTRQQYTYSSPISDWQSYTPTGSWSTNTTYAGKWRRVGDSAEYDIKLTLSGAPTATSLHVNLNSGHVIDTAKMSYGESTNYNLGELQILDSSGGNTWQGKIKYRDTTSVGAVFMSVTGSEVDVTTVSSTSPITFATGDTVYLRFKLPITGWQSSALSADQNSQQPVVFKIDDTVVTPTSAAFNGTTALIFNGTPLFDSNAAYSTSTGRFTAPTAGKYQVVGRGAINATYSSGNKVGIEVWKNSSQIASGQVRVVAAIIQTIFADVETTVDLVAGDTVELRLRTAGTSPAISVDGTGSYSFEVSKIQGPSSITSTELVSVIAQSTNAQSFTTGVAATVTTWTELQDTHAALDASTGVFTVPVAGTYSVLGMIAFAANGTGVRELTLQKNGSGTYASLDRQTGDAADGNYLQGTSVVKCNQGDTLRLVGNQTSGGNLALQGAAAYQRFEITKVGI